MLWKAIVRQMTGRVVGQVTTEQRKPGNLLDLRLGVALLRDRRVPPMAKLLSLGLGLVLTYVLIAVEMPLEGIVAAIAPGLGITADVLMDGAETILCPMLFAALLLPHVAPQPVTQEARADRRTNDPRRLSGRR